MKITISLSVLILLLCFSARAQTPQLEVNGIAGEDAIKVVGGQNGLSITSITSGGITLNGIGGIGINMFGTGSTGMNIIQSGGDGLYMFNQNGHGIRLDETVYDGIKISNASWHAGYFSNKASSIYPAVKLQAGSDANMDLGFSGHARLESDGSYIFYLDQNANSSSDRIVIVNSDSEDVFDVNESGNAILKNSLSISNSSGRSIVIDQAGDDGIHITNSFDSGLNVFGAGGHGGFFQTSATSPSPAIEASAGDDNNLDLRLNAHGKMATGGDLEIFLDDNNNATNQFVIHRSGTPGILGTKILTASESYQVWAYSLALGVQPTTPTGYRLSVDGKMIAEEVVVQLKADWPDYVFEKDYERLKLDEVEQFIYSNGHLPGIPAASSVEENGLTLGEMQRFQMEKIEELTLYIIELKKEIELLKYSLK